MAVDEIRVDVVESVVATFVAEVVRLTQDGYKVCPSNSGDVVGAYGNVFTVTMVRNQESVDAFMALSKDVQEKPKLSRAEILEKARAARKPKIDVATIQ